MKIKRLKCYRKTLDIYAKYFGLNLDPLEIFLDNTFVRHAIINKLNIEQQFKCTLDCPVSLVTSSCVISECEALGSIFEGALKVLQTFKILKCRHKVGSKDVAIKCIRRRIHTVNDKSSKIQKRKNKSLLFAVATNDTSLHVPCRKVSGIPLFYIAHKRINMLSISNEIMRTIESMAANAGFLSVHEEAAIRSIEQKFGVIREENTVKHLKKTKGPNSLSCKRKLLKTVSIPKMQVVKKRQRKRRRNRIKVTWAMKQAIECLKQDLGIIND